MYSPKINETLVQQLYQLKLIVRKPMTQIVNIAIKEYLDKQRKVSNERRN
jgi:hypothetical protein